MERSPAVEGPRLSFATIEDVGISESLLLFRYCHSLPNTHGETELLEAENLWDTEKHHTLEGFLLNHIGLERRTEYFNSNSTISIKFEDAREIHYKFKHSLELYIGQFFLFWKTKLQGFIIWQSPLHKPGQHIFLFTINICNLQEIFLNDTCLKSRKIFLAVSFGNEYCLELYSEALGTDEMTHSVMALTDLQYKPDDLSFLPEPTWKEIERTSSTELSSDLHKCIIACTHTYTIIILNKNLNIFKSKALTWHRGVGNWY